MIAKISNTKGYSKFYLPKKILIDGKSYLINSIKLLLLTSIN